MNLQEKGGWVDLPMAGGWMGEWMQGWMDGWKEWLDYSCGHIRTVGVLDVLLPLVWGRSRVKFTFKAVISSYNPTHQSRPSWVTSPCLLTSSSPSTIFVNINKTVVLCNRHPFPVLVWKFGMKVWKMYEWRSEWMNEWMKEWRSEWVNEGVKEWMSEWRSEGVNEWMKEWMKQWEWLPRERC